MPAEEDPAARKRRSDRIHKRISDFVSESAETPDDNAPPPPEPETPRQFVEKRMRELGQSESRDEEDS